ncbi:MAG: transaldolase family protein [Chloroflexota bacterium]
MATTLASPLQRMASEFPNDYWNDSCSAAELAYAIDNGAVGATSNPTIVATVMKQEYDVWAPRVGQIMVEHPEWTDQQITWQVIEEMAIRGWKMLEPIYQRESGQKGRLSIQTNPTLNPSPGLMVEQARHFDTLAPNVQVKFPATRAGLEAIEEATYDGISINATVSFTVAQALAVGEAVDSALKRREAEGHDTSWMAPVCTIMIGRTDDWVKRSCERDGIIVDPAAADWAGIAVFKRAAATYQERGYRTRLLAAAYRHHLHWSELIGGDVSGTIPAGWQRRFNASAIEVRDRWSDPVPAAYVDELSHRVPEFVKAYEPDGLSVPEFDTYGATMRTLRGFIASYWQLVGTIDELMIPDPDVKP